MKFTPAPASQDLVYIISSVPERQKWVLLHEGAERHFPDRGQGKIPGLVDAIRHCFWSGEGQDRPSLLLIQHGGQQFRLRFHADLPLTVAGDGSSSASDSTFDFRRESNSEPLPALAHLCAMG
ncbi:hypothetical protein [Verrucomicrobium sp. BvORR106]|uniref:hypothetical protein n=1 Tax=Verrucomicrobium sp. BvORR106 TaxID=1403819 RepID=UPI000571AC0D|nr:hypothetical protein [Verrucomicrobium sp. BvORR106]